MVFDSRILELNFWCVLDVQTQLSHHEMMNRVILHQRDMQIISDDQYVLFVCIWALVLHSCISNMEGHRLVVKRVCTDIANVSRILQNECLVYNNGNVYMQIELSS